jgi:hypothetical protein
MQSLRKNKLLLVGVTSAILCTAAGYMITAASEGNRCKSGECTYFDANGQRRPGTCGTKQDDNKNCYCIVNDNKKLSQKQLVCSAEPEK